MEKSHTVILNEGKRLSVSGVDDVISFDEEAVVLAIGERELNIGGHDLCVTKLSLETNEVAVSGDIEAMYYSTAKPKKGLFKGIFG